MREIWFIEVRLHKSHAITGLSLGQIVWAQFLSVFLGSSCGNWARWVYFYFLFFTNPIFGCRAILVI